MELIISLLVTLVAFLIALTNPNIAGEKERKKVRALALLIGSLAAIISIYQTISKFLVIMPAGKVGVVEILGNVSESTLTPGLHLVNPLAKVIKFSTRLKDLKETVTATSKEGLNFQIDVSLQYKIDPEQAGQVYENIGLEEKEIIISRFRSLIREITSNYESRDIYSEKRQEIANSLLEKLTQELNPLGFIVESALFRDI
ncbi:MULTISPECIES: prohibitin family protein [Okeania]|uniref:prohibitin family protein n=1 Tax=Okeania TaxID=1458928 RepID=UPI00195F5D88|nr:MULTISPECIES: prohibitin family protein [Okeania]